MADMIYSAFKKKIADGTLDLDLATAGAYKVMLVTSSYTPSAAHDFRDDITNEVSGTGYTAGGTNLPNPAVNIVSTSAYWDADDVSWATATITARGAVIYRARGGASSADELCCYIDFGSDKTSTGGTFAITWAANGIIQIG